MQLFNIISTFMFAASAKGDIWTGVDSLTTTTTFTTTLTTSIAIKRTGNEQSQVLKLTMPSPIRKEKMLEETTHTSILIQTFKPENLSWETKYVSHVVKCCQIKRTSALTSQIVFDADYITTSSGCRSSTRATVSSTSSTTKKSSSSTGGAGRIGLTIGGLGLIAAVLA